MPRTRLARVLLAVALAAAAAAAGAATLKPYRDDAEIAAAIKRWQEASTRHVARRAAEQGAMSFNGAVGTAAPAAPAALAEAKDEATSITNVQTAGVDEGGIVKRAGDFLVVLRRGRLFTVRVGGDALQPVSRLDAYAPGSDPQGAWYDELLVSGRDVVVIGYSYARGGTEIGLFEMGADGSLAYRATYHLRSFDYYSSRNYASRLIGRRLVFYTPTLMQPWAPMPFSQWMPGLRRFDPGLPADFERLLPATRIYRSDDDFAPDQPLALHTVTGCELGGASLRCESSAVLGPAGRVFYVSGNAVYVWTSTARRRWPPAGFAEERQSAAVSAVFRLPLDGSAPGGLKTSGVPVDQMSFLEAGGQLNVLVRQAGEGEGMWGAARSQGALALLRVPLADFGDGRGAARREQYRRLPGPEGWALQNRFVGPWLLWGGGDAAWALRFEQPQAEASSLAPGHQVERIEAMAGDALLVGQRGGDLHFSAVRLASRGEARIEGRHVQPGARQGETRTHGFFYRPTGESEGLLGLPVLGSRNAMVFLRQRELRFEGLGALEASRARPADDACRASCVDWYGNARPIFLGERMLALMGYEIVEGRLERGGFGRERIEELRRISFAPPARGRGNRESPFE